MEIKKKNDDLEGKIIDIPTKKNVHFVCAHGFAISSTYAWALRDYIDKNEIRGYDVFQKGWQVPEQMAEINDNDYVFVAKPFREEFEKIRSEGKIKSNNVHYVEMPFTRYVKEYELKNEFASNIMEIMKKE